MRDQPSCTCGLAGWIVRLNRVFHFRVIDGDIVNGKCGGLLVANNFVFFRLGEFDAEAQPFCVRLREALDDHLHGDVTPDSRGRIIEGLDEAWRFHDDVNRDGTLDLAVVIGDADCVGSFVLPCRFLYGQSDL